MTDSPSVAASSSGAASSGAASSGASSSGASSSSASGSLSSARASGKGTYDRPDQKRPIIASTINFKGGVGKTTSCLNLAAAAYEEGLSVLILDLDPQGSATEFAKLERGHQGPTLYNWLTRGAPLQEVAVEIRGGGSEAGGSIFLCPADERLTKIQYLFYTKGNPSYLKEALAEEARAEGTSSLETSSMAPSSPEASSPEAPPFLSRFDFVFLDVPPSVSAFSQNVLVASDLALLVLSCQFMSVTGIRRFTDVLRLAHRAGAYPEWYILPTFYRPTEIESSLVWSRVAEVAKVYPEGRLLSPIGRFAAFGQAFQTGKSIFEFDRGHPGAEQFAAVFAEILEAAGQVDAPPQERSLEGSPSSRGTPSSEGQRAPE